MGKRTNFNPSGELEGFILYSVNLGEAVEVEPQSDVKIIVELQVFDDSYPGGDRATPPGGGTPLEPNFPRPGVMFRPRFEGDIPVCKASPQVMLPTGLMLAQVRFIPGTWTVSQPVNSISGAQSAPIYTCVIPDELFIIIANNDSEDSVDIPANTLINVLLERG